MAHVVNALEPIKSELFQQCETIFLAGPAYRGQKEEPCWRDEIIEYSRNWKNLILISPEPKGGHIDEDAYYLNQMNWELKSMGQADVILFWVPRDLEKLPGFTTNVEFGFWAAKNPRKVSFGCPPGAPKTEYLRHLAVKRGIAVDNSLPELFESAFRSAVLRKQKRNAKDHDEAFIL